MEYKQVIVIRNDLKMDKGKIAAQASHASLSAYEKALISNPRLVNEWKESGQKKIVLKVDSLLQITELFNSLKNIYPCALIKDAGHTQVLAGSITALGIGPVDSSIDKFTKDLKLL